MPIGVSLPPMPEGSQAPPLPGSEAAQLESYEAIVALAAQASGCSTAIVSRMLDDELRHLAGAKAGPLRGVFAMSDNSDVLSEIDMFRLQVGSELPMGIRFGGENAAHLCFASSVPIPGKNPAFLIVLHDRQRAPLNSAQNYVLHAHAAHLSTLFELAVLREHVDSADSPENRANTERLRLLESVAIHARDSIVITEAEPVDLPGPRILYCNAAFTRATGYAADEVIGLTPRLLQGPKTDPAARARLRGALLAWEPIEIEMINYRKGGEEFWVELSIVPVADEQGWFTHWVSVQRDITERKNAEELAARVHIAEIENRALTAEILQRKRVEAELLYAAFHDSLTRLRNRAFFMERLAKALVRTKASRKGACSVLFLDLDRFKIVNDSLGHLEGDRLLMEVAQRLKQCVSAQDTLARIGGDEFAILIEDALDLTVPVQVAEDIIETLRKPIQLGRQSVFPSCSIGIVHVSEPGFLPDDVMRDADIAMYEAKRSGYGDYAIFDGSMHDEAVARLSLQTDLRQAVERNEFHLVYQPIVDPVTGAILSLEALLRWNHPVRGAIAPDDFVPVAEEIGLIRLIDRWVMREACTQLARWHTQFADQSLRMSVNTSAAEFVNGNFVEHLTNVLKDLGLSAGSLELEITEGIFLHHSPDIAETIAALRSLGVRIALDDFGTGYSSLSYINHYPIDTIKIDKSFIDGVCSNPQNHAIVQLIINLGAALEINVIAEGVETQEQAELLTQIGCSAIQGYYYARPLDLGTVTRLLGSGRVERSDEIFIRN